MTAPEDGPHRDDGPAADVPSVARIYDRLLDGAQNFAADRDRASAISTTYPRAAEWARADRAFIRHAVEHAVDLGIGQFLDLGSGIPTAGAVHEIATGARADARVAYVDHEPVAVARTQSLLAGVDNASITRADVRDVEAVLAAPGVTRVLDLSRPVLVIAAAVLHFVPDDDRPAEILARYRRALAPGSVLALTHTSNDLPDDPELAAAHRAVLALYEDTNDRLRSRTRAELRTLVASAGFSLGGDGLVELGRWAGGGDGRAVGGYALISEPLPDRPGAASPAPRERPTSSSPAHRTPVSAAAIPAVGTGPSVARMYDRLLGGAHNFGPDREQVDALAEAYPMMPTLVQANRNFLRHAVEHALALGVRQFLDLGSGIPTVGNVHEIAHRHDPTARVAYVDHEPTAAAHARTMLADVALATMTEGDLRDPDAVLAAPGVAGLLDLDRPVAVLALSVLHFADDPTGALAGYRRVLAPGSFVALSHTSADYPDRPDLVTARRRIVELYAATGEVVRDRSRLAIRRIVEEAGFTVGPDWPIDVATWAPPQHDGTPLGGYALITDPLAG